MSSPIVVERFGSLLLPLNGNYEYKGVRGKQGRQRNKFQGYTPKKRHTTRLCGSAQEAAVALATLREELAAGFDSAEHRPPRKRRRSLTGTRYRPRRPAP